MANCSSSGEGGRVHGVGDLAPSRYRPCAERTSSTWADFLRSQADALLGCDFLETVPLSGTRMHVLVIIEHATRRIRNLGATAHPTAAWVPQAAKNLVMDLEDADCRARFIDPRPRWVRQGQGPASVSSTWTRRRS
jgi:hypothetical protein